MEARASWTGGHGTPTRISQLSAKADLATTPQSAREAPARREVIMAASLIAIYANNSLRLSPMFHRPPLDYLNFFLADVRGGLGAYVGVFLLTQAHWNQVTIGAVLTVSGLIGITLHTPIGALIDTTHFKRGLIIVGTCALAVSALAIAWAPTLPVVLTADILMAGAGAIFAPTVAAITLGISSQQGLPARLVRTQPPTGPAIFSSPS